MIAHHAPAHSCVVAAILALFGFACGGCDPSGIPKGGYLNDTSKLRQTDLSEEMYVQFNEKSLARYDRFMLSPLSFGFTPRRPRPVSMRDLDAGEAAYRTAVAEALSEGDRFRQAQAPGRGVLLLRAAVTDRFQRDESEPAPGPATLELEAVDSITRKRVFAVIDPTFAQRDSGGEHTTAQDAFARFARRLRARLDDLAYAAQLAQPG